MTGHKQTTDGNEYTTGYTYKLSGALDEQTYPSGRVVKNELDVSGDLASVTSKENPSAIYKTYANDFTYTAAGAVSSLKLGNGRFESTQFNNRLQPTQIALGSSVGNAGLLKIDYTYNTTGNADNNGNLLSQTITVPGLSHPFVQTYTYDELNRLKSATETNNSTQTWKQTFTFDRYGNRRFDEANTTMPTSFSNQALTNPTISTSNNRLTSTGWTYDSAGNTTGDPDGRSFIYDAENKQIEVKNSSNASIGTYFFDGDGKRVKKVVPSTGETTIFVYDAAGKQIAEYSTVVASANDAKVAYLTADHLGSPRINTDVNGQVTARHDYHPFGEEIDGTGGRTTGLNYGSDTVRKQFTGYERDGETELDFAQARMYENRLGRFTTFDPGPFTPADPQNWNRYAFTLNNPLKFVDPSGKEIELSGQEAQAFVDYLEKKTGLKLKYKVKNGVIRITGSSRDKNFTGTVNEKLRDVVKSAASAAEVAKYEVGKNLINANGNDVFVDDNGDSWNGPRTKDGQLRTSMVDMADINQLDAGATEFAQGLVGHFLEEGIEMRKPGANYENTGTPGAHEKGLKVEAEIISAAVGSKQDTRFQPEGQDQNSKVFNFVYTTVQYDLTFKSTGVTVVKTVPPSVQRPKKQK